MLRAHAHTHTHTHTRTHLLSAKNNAVVDKTCFTQTVESLPVASVRFALAVNKLKRVTSRLENDHTVAAGVFTCLQGMIDVAEGWMPKV